MLLYVLRWPGIDIRYVTLWSKVARDIDIRYVTLCPKVARDIDIRCYAMF